MSVNKWGYVTVWACPKPAEGTVYQVLREEWDDDLTVRHIYEIRTLGVYVP